MGKVKQAALYRTTTRGQTATNWPGAARPEMKDFVPHEPTDADAETGKAKEATWEENEWLLLLRALLSSRYSANAEHIQEVRTMHTSL